MSEPIKYVCQADILEDPEQDTCGLPSVLVITWEKRTGEWGNKMQLCEKHARGINQALDKVFM